MTESTRFSAAAKAALLAVVAQTPARTEWSVRRILPLLGLSVARYKAWTKRAAAQALTDRAPVAPRRDAILPEEKAAVITYALGHPKDGYRRLTWQMIDADVAYLSESSVVSDSERGGSPRPLEALDSERPGAEEANAAARAVAH